MAAPATLRFEISPAEAGARLDSALARAAGITRSQAGRWIEEGRVGCNGRPAAASRRVAAGDVVEARPPEVAPEGLVPEAIPLAILHDDADVVVLDKPAHLVVHAGPGHATGTLVNALLHLGGGLSALGGALRPGIVHRLDRGTSGVMVVARHDAAHRSLAGQFRRHSVERVYLAFVRGLPSAGEGRVDRPIGRHRTERKRMSVAAGVGRAARTAWRVLERFEAAEASLLEVRPETGRTHQIRVHLASAGLPILGDPVYGRARVAALDRPALHAAVLGFEHPRSGARVRFEAPLPGDLAALREALRRER
jgi:23S rRNA pseudouridine1911/1915/1917 synthase